MNTLDLSDWDVVVVSHNSGEALRSEWAEAPEALRARVICIENGGAAESVAIARELFPAVEVVPNRGLSVANNLGFSLGHAPYVLFANPDLRVDASDLPAFARMLEAEPGIVAPRLVGASGEAQASVRGWPSLPQQVLNRLLPESHAVNTTYLWPDTSSGRVPWVLGAAVATRRSDMERVGGWPENYFLYFEDTVLCINYWRAGMSVRVNEESRWFHAWAKSSRGVLSWASRRHMASAARFYLHNPLLALGLGGATLGRRMRGRDA